jgi:uncharacterized protein YbcC (UPF0753/DUF2309 family)
MFIDKTQKSVNTTTSKLKKEFTLRAFETAKKSISPVWDVRDYVAVNPFFGLRDKPFIHAIKYVQALTGERLMPESAHYKADFAAGKITSEDIEFALAQVKLKNISESFEQANHDTALEKLDESKEVKRVIHGLSDLYDLENKTNITEKITQSISSWLSAYFDEGQAQWKMPHRDKRFYAAWKKVAIYQKPLAEINGDFKEMIKTLPSNPVEAVEILSGILVEEYNLTESDLENYFARLLMSMSGWASYMQKYEFEAARTGSDEKLNEVGGLIDLLAVRLAYDFLLRKDIIQNFKKSLTINPNELFNIDYDYIWLLASEHSYRRSVLKQVEIGEVKQTNPDFQMAFCIDVRSEIIRRKIEKVLPKAQTIGFAGFFGMPIDYKGLGHENSDQNCPILLNSAVEINEVNIGKSLVEAKRSKVEKVKMKKQVQASSNSCFSFVETLGWSYIGKTLINSTGLKKPNINVPFIGLGKKQIETLRPDTESLPLELKVQLANGALKNMGLTNFAPYVIFFGHASESSNNPFASGLDCGACAGHSGQSNARVLAQILNDKEVRSHLKTMGREIPETTLFLSGLHNTTKDDLGIDMPTNLSAKQAKEIADLEVSLAKATAATIDERSAKLNFMDVEKKANDWSEIRPEWGLAGNAAFLVTSRERTRAGNYAGRTFMHDYDPNKDQDLSVLELIMTAPMVVTNWINMQYYASAVSPEKFGSGNKVLHNVVGTIGAIQGNSSDLLVGLSEQSVRYKGEYVHEPTRLQVVIESTTEKINQMIEKHQMVKELVSNEWVNLICLDTTTKKIHFYESAGWLTLEGGQDE